MGDGAAGRVGGAIWARMVSATDAAIGPAGSSVLGGALASVGAASAASGWVAASVLWGVLSSIGFASPSVAGCSAWVLVLFVSHS